MRPSIFAALLVAAPALTIAQGPSSDRSTAPGSLHVSDVKIAEPARVAELDMDELKGEPFRLGWSPDGSQLYVQTLDGTWADANTGRSNVTFHHYLFSAGVGRNFSSATSATSLDAPPFWFAGYWGWKNGRHAPGVPELSIDLQTEQEKRMTTSVPMGGDLAKGGAGATSTSAGDAGAAAYNSQWIPIHTMVYKGEKIGQFVNTVIVPGLTYGWGPPGSNILAFAALGSGAVTIVDERGDKLVVRGSKDALLPAWSLDGTRLAWLQKNGRKKYVLFVAAIESKK
jgi:hypothetical protein